MVKISGTSGTPPLRPLLTRVYGGLHRPKIKNHRVQAEYKSGTGRGDTRFQNWLYPAVSPF